MLLTKTVYDMDAYARCLEKRVAQLESEKAEVEKAEAEKAGAVKVEDKKEEDESGGSSEQNNTAETGKTQERKARKED